MSDKNGRGLKAMYEENVFDIGQRLSVKDNFDVIERRICSEGGEMCFFYIDGFVKDSEMLRIMQHLMTQKNLSDPLLLLRSLPYVEVELCYDSDKLVHSVLSGQTALLCEGLAGVAVLIDARTYPARETTEPTSDRVMQGAHDGFVETLITNTSLIRRRIRDVRLTMEHYNMGGSSGTDVVLCYMRGVADEKEIGAIRDKLASARPKSLTLGFQSLSETLIRRGWYNPFPKIRTTERPDTAAAQLLEGSILVICDTSPLVMVFPTSIFNYLEQTDDYYFPPLTGTYLRIVRLGILLLSLVITPLWYLCIMNADKLPLYLTFLVPDEPGKIPIILQLILIEFAVDGLKIASMNTPDMLSNSLSVIGALILGDFAVSVGWVCEDVILYMAFVSIAGFAQQNIELGYAFKFVRIITLILVSILDVWGFVLGMLLFLFLVATNTTVCGKRKYLYPLIPFDYKALLHMFVRTPKRDFNIEDNGDKNAKM